MEVAVGARQQDDTVTRLAPELVDEPELWTGLKEAYLEEKALSSLLSNLADWKEAGWRPTLARQVKAEADIDQAHIQILTGMLDEIGLTPPERPETRHPRFQGSMEVHQVLSGALEAKKDLEIRYVRVTSLANLEGRWPIAARLENLAKQEAAGRSRLLTVLGRYRAFHPED
jgi:hypothetical protein